MILSIDLWHGEWGFGFSIFIWERYSRSSLVKLGFTGQIKGFGKSRQADIFWEIEDDPKRLCRYCGETQSYGDEGSMVCKLNRSKSDETAKNCAYFWFFLDNVEA